MRTNKEFIFDALVFFTIVVVVALGISEAGYQFFKHNDHIPLPDTTTSNFPKDF